MDISSCRYLLSALLIFSQQTGTNMLHAEEDLIMYCCDTSNGCCGRDWELHCCNFAAKICCYRDERIHSLRHHIHRNWGWDHHWIKVIVYFVIFALIITGLILCCKGRSRRQGRGLTDYTVVPGYAQSSYPTAPVQQNFPAEEYPLIDYRTGQPQGHSLNSNQRVSPPPYYNAA